VTNTLFGQLLPFQLAGFLVSTTSSSGTSSVNLSPTYTFGTNGIPPVEAFSYPSTYTYGANSTGPFRLVYPTPQSPSSLNTPTACPGNSSIQCFNAIVVYQVV
jgi:hypothetical protein